MNVRSKQDNDKGHDMKKVSRTDKIYIALISLIAVAGFSYWNHLENLWNEYTCDPAPVIIQEGQNLYQIASAHCTGNIGNAVDDLVIEYGTTQIYPGQQIWLSSKP
jgi:hypothetical protein